MVIEVRLAISAALAFIRKIEQDFAAGQGMGKGLLKALRWVDYGDRCAEL